MGIGRVVATTILLDETHDQPCILIVTVLWKGKKSVTSNSVHGDDVLIVIVCVSLHIFRHYFC